MKHEEKALEIVVLGDSAPRFNLPTAELEPIYLPDPQDTTGQIEALREVLRSMDAPVLVIRQADKVHLAKDAIERLGNRAQALSGVLFPASAHMDFEDPALFYFYWKHYPRPHSHYNFLDASVFSGHPADIIRILDDIEAKYLSQKQTASLQVLFHRYYADGSNGCFSWPVSVALDHEQDLFAVTQRSAVPKLGGSWMYQVLYTRNERAIYHQNDLSGALKYPLNILEKDGRFSHCVTGKSPAVVVTEPVRSAEEWPRPRLQWKIFWKTIRQFYFASRKNRWNNSYERIFRFSPNKSVEIADATERIVKRLENGQPLSFAHYNDGELTFIRDFLRGADHERWFGRKQQQYHPLLAQRLHDAMQFRKEGYFVGVPCSVHHPKLRKVADKVVGAYDYKVQAMAIHHNLAYMPRILHALKKRNVYFFTNDYQDLSFFQYSGIDVDAEKVTVVPFRNSYLEYERYEQSRFPEDAVVVLTCGMLAKILTRAWYERHDSLTVLALGSSLDDHIQKENIQFELYPKDLPLTGNIHGGRPFLFGYKKQCRECYKMT